jgi:Tol biopolymer transport system component
MHAPEVHRHAYTPRGSTGSRLLGAIATGLLLSACASSTVPSTPLDGASPTVSSPTASPTPVPTPSPTPVYPTVAAGLAYIRLVDGVPEVFVTDDDGSDRQLTSSVDQGSVPAVVPTWSPDRSMIIFRPRSIGSGTDPQLWVINADGSGARALAPVGESIGWSPDSSRLLFEDSVITTDSRGEPPRMWLLDLATGEATILGRGTSPRWLPDGERISYTPITEGPREREAPILVMRLPDGQPQEVAVALGAWWSPDGTGLLLLQQDGLYLADPDGGNPRFLVEGGTPLAWSHDGSRLVYTYDVTAEEALPIIGVVDRDGTVLWDGQVGGDPTWSPDGTRLAVEVGLTDVSIAILNAENGRVIWQMEGQDPAW